MAIDRRSLIRRSCLTAAALAARPCWAAAGIFRTAREVSSGSRASADTILVVVDISGGNDGLNTVVPFSDPAYRAGRTRIGLTGSQLLPVDSRTGLHPSLAHLHGYLQSGKLAIVQNVGYPRPDMSHFVSDDIWEKATLDPHLEPTGWLGRALDQAYGADADQIHSVSSAGDVAAFHGNVVTTPVITDTGAFNYPQWPVSTEVLRALFRPGGGANRDYVAHVGDLALSDADAIQAVVAKYTSTIQYPEGPFAAALRLTSSVIASDIGARIFFVGQGGYDTHDSQLGVHEALLLELDLSLDAFYRDLVEHGVDQKVVVMTYSEFGRRVEDNASGGTDHGSAGPMFVLGTRVKGGFFGAPPSLTDLDPDGNLKFSIDFRQVYASILANWIDTDPAPVLFGTYPTLSFV